MVWNWYHFVAIAIFTSASSYGLGWYEYAIATQWYQFHTTDAWWFSLSIYANGHMYIPTFINDILMMSSIDVEYHHTSL